MISRGFGNCHVTSTLTRDVWRVQYFNAMNTLILDTLEVVGVPEVALASSEDLADSRERLAELLHGWTSRWPTGAQAEAASRALPGLRQRRQIAPGTRLECKICWYVYDPAQGDPVWQVPPGTPFTELPPHWTCPNCAAAAEPVHGGPR